jgi:urease accessory protein
MEVIREELTRWDPALPTVFVRATRHDLAKRRWRGVADDGMEFGFDLEQPWEGGEIFFQNERARYAVTQVEEPVLEITLEDPQQAARIAWMLGNLHMSIEIAADGLRVVDDEAVRQLFQREAVSYRIVNRVFCPLRAVAHVH